MFGKEMKYLISILKKHLTIIVSYIFVKSINDTTTLIIPYFFKVVLDTYIPEKKIVPIYIACSIIALILIIDFFISRIRIYKFSKFISELQCHIRNKIFDNLQQIKYKYFNKKTYGEMNTNIIQDVESLVETLFGSLIGSIVEIIFFIIVLILIIKASLLLTGIILGLIIIFTLIISKLKEIMSRNYELFAIERVNLNVTINDIVTGIKIIKAYIVEKEFSKLLKDANKKFIKKWLITNIFAPIIQSSIEIAMLISYLSIFIVGSILLEKQMLTAGEMMLFISYLSQLWSRIGTFTNMYNAFLKTKVYAERVFSAIDFDSETAWKEKGQLIDSRVKTLEFNNISFSYNNSITIFDKFNLRIDDYGLYYIIGESGIGKSTLFDLLLGFYDLDGGDILLNGNSIKKYSVSQLRSIIGIVHQEIFLINDTVMNNIKFHDDKISSKEIIKLSQEIGFHKYLSGLEKGYDTVVEHFGGNLSLGQKRMVTILRVLCRDPGIILFDEITANTDSYTEILINSFIKTLSRSKICLNITHKNIDLASDDKIIRIEALKNI